MNFVFDTSVLISAALLKNSIPDQAFEKAQRTGRIIRSENTYAELKEVIHRKKFNKYLRAIDRYKFLAQFKAETLSIVITRKVSVCRDP